MVLEGIATLLYFTLKQNFHQVSLSSFETKFCPNKKHNLGNWSFEFQNFMSTMTVSVRISHLHAVCSFMSDSLLLLCPWNFPGNNTRVGCHFLLQGIFLA